MRSLVSVVQLLDTHPPSLTYTHIHTHTLSPTQTIICKLRWIQFITPCSLHNMTPPQWFRHTQQCFRLTAPLLHWLILKRMMVHCLYSVSLRMCGLTTRLKLEGEDDCSLVPACTLYSTDQQHLFQLSPRSHCFLYSSPSPLWSLQCVWV